jgi:hypothetical protein
MKMALRQIEKETENITKVIDALKAYGKPVSVSYVAWKLEITWSTARGILLKMALNGKITAIETSKGYFFSLKSN